MCKPTKIRSKPRGTETDTSHRLGFVKGEFSVPDDFDQMGKDVIAHSFNAATISTRGYRFDRNEANKRQHIMAADWRITEVSVLDDKSIRVRFTDGLEGVVRFPSDFYHGVFSHLNDPAKFREVAVVDGAVTWPGGLDLAPDAMYQEIKLHGERQATLGKVTQDVVRQPGAWCELPEAKVDWDSSNTNENIAQALSGDGV